MKEREAVTKYLKKLKEDFPLAHIYKIGDTFGGHKKKYDVVGCYRGLFFAVEFKTPGGSLLPHQETAGAEVWNSGGFWACQTIPGPDYLRDWLLSRPL